MAPFSWWLHHHINEGCEHFDVSDRGMASVKKRDHKVEEAMELLKERDMPLPSCTWTHADARLTEAQRTLLAQYFEGLSSQLNEGRDH